MNLTTCQRARRLKKHLTIPYISTRLINPDASACTYVQHDHYSPTKSSFTKYTCTEFSCITLPLSSPNRSDRIPINHLFLIHTSLSISKPEKISIPICVIQPLIGLINIVFVHRYHMCILPTFPNFHFVLPNSSRKTLPSPHRQ